MRTPRFAPALACAALCVWPGTSAFADGTDCGCNPAPVAAPVVRKPVVRSAPKPQTVVNVTNQYFTPPPAPIQVVATQTVMPMMTAVGTPIVASSVVAPMAAAPGIVTTTSVGYPQNYAGATVTTATAYTPAQAYAPVMAAPMVPVTLYPTQPNYAPVSVYPQEPSYYDRTPRVGEVLPPFYVRSRAMESWNDGGQQQQAPNGQVWVQSGLDMLLTNVATGVITQVILGGLRGGFGGGRQTNTVTYNRTVNTTYQNRPAPMCTHC